MYKFIGARGSGKTHKILEYAAENGYTVIEPTYNMARYVAEFAREKGYYGIKVISADEFSKKIMFCKIDSERYVVDELDLFLEKIGIKGYTNSKEDNMPETVEPKGISW